MPQSQPDIVLFFADLGKPYLQLIARMSQSARRTMPNSRLILLTPTPRKKYTKLFDKIVDLSAEMKVSESTLCYDRVRAMVSWQSMSKTDTIYVDPDIEFVRPAGVGDFDVGLMWRKKKPDQPVNTGLIIARAGHDEFWRQYGSIVANLPIPLRAWWCDQLGFSILIGRTAASGKQRAAGDTFISYDAKVHLFDMDSTCSFPERATNTTIAHHYKGNVKNDVLNFPERFGATS